MPIPGEAINGLCLNKHAFCNVSVIRSLYSSQFRIHLSCLKMNIS